MFVCLLIICESQGFGLTRADKTSSELKQRLRNSHMHQTKVDFDNVFSQCTENIYELPSITDPVTIQLNSLLNPVFIEIRPNQHTSVRNPHPLFP
jgi:hypothetical protein